jgi:murein DD-endopeptidase MepM/ murein hydrolase activator NlpD
MVTQSKVISLVAWARAEGGGVNGHNGTFNPLNTKLDHDDLQGENQGNVATDSNSQGYPTFDIGVEAITRGIFGSYQKRIGSALLQQNFPQDALIEAIAGDFYSPDGVTVINRLEDIYPGDKIWAALSITGFDYGGGIGDRELYVSIMRDTLENVKENYEEYAGAILDGSPEGTPAPLVFGSTGGGGLNYTGGGCSQEDGGSVNTEGYSFPLEPQTKSGIGGITTNQVTSSHWDESAAYDLFGPVDADVYSLYAGTPVKINTNFNDVQGCTSIQFEADDGYFYFYGHLKNPVVAVGQHIEAGVKMAEIADSSFGTDCTGNGGSHLHIDRGCTTDEGPQWGGNKSCRDVEFIELLSKIFEVLP